MTVKILNDHQKKFICNNYTGKYMNQKQLAKHFLVSERTINRVLNEAGLATAVPRLKGEAYRAMQVLKKHNVSVDQLDSLLTNRCYYNHAA